MSAGRPHQPLAHKGEFVEAELERPGVGPAGGSREFRRSSRMRESIICCSSLVGRLLHSTRDTAIRGCDARPLIRWLERMSRGRGPPCSQYARGLRAPSWWSHRLRSEAHGKPQSAFACHDKQLCVQLNCQLPAASYQAAKTAVPLGQLAPSHRLPTMHLRGA